jgi:hypothetical protein
MCSTIHWFRISCADDYQTLMIEEITRSYYSAVDILKPILAQHNPSGSAFSSLVLTRSIRYYKQSGSAAI